MYRKTEETDFSWTSYGRNRVLLMGRGVAYRKTEETDLCWSARSKWGSCSSGGVWRIAKRDSTGYCSSPPSTASTGYCSSTVDLLQPPHATVHPRRLSSCLHQPLFIQPPPLLHRLLFNQPSPWGPVQPPLHGLLFIQPTTGYCSTSSPRGPVHPALDGVLFIHAQSA